MMSRGNVDALPPEVDRKMIRVLNENGCEYQLRLFGSRAHRASEAAHLLDCQLGAVVKSLIFQNTDNGELALVLVSGENRVDLNRLGQILRGKFLPAKPRQIKSITGYEVGAVPPVGVETTYPVIIDADLMSYDAVWASAGSVFALVQIKSQDLMSLTGGRVESIHS